jgi:hypothetical protein
MKESEWIDPREKLPKIDQFVEVSFSVRGKLFEVQRVKFSINQNGFIGFIGEMGLMCNIDSILGWRPISEKRPDFSRLRNGDLLMIYSKNEAHKSGFLFDIRKDGRHEELLMTHYQECRSYGWFKNTDEIKKITRINLEHKTFEEI